MDDVEAFSAEQTVQPVHPAGVQLGADTEAMGRDPVLGEPWDQVLLPVEEVRRLVDEVAMAPAGRVLDQQPFRAPGAEALDEPQHPETGFRARHRRSCRAPAGVPSASTASNTGVPAPTTTSTGHAGFRTSATMRS